LTTRRSHCAISPAACYHPRVLTLPDPLLRLSLNLKGVWRSVDPRSRARYAAALALCLPAVARERNLRPVDERMRGKPVTFDVDGTRITLAGDDFAAAREMYCRRVYVSHPHMRIEPGAQVVDLGANIGLFSLLAAKRGARVLAVEAQAGFIRELRARMLEQHCAAAVATELALIGAGVGIFAEVADIASASHYEAGQDTPMVEMSDLLARHHIDQIDFLKVDIEGSEFALFRRGEPWLSGVRRIAMEVHGPFGSARALRAQLDAAGFATSLHDDLLRPIDELGAACGYLFAWRS
jgi:FkbM family methyltransferase